MYRTSGLSSLVRSYSTALVTGASSGIGEAFARLLAAQGNDLILVARSEVKLRRLAEALAEKHGIRAEVIAADPSAMGSARQVYEEVTRRGLSVGLLVNNAGFGSYGLFNALPLEREGQEIALNVTALVELTHLFLPEMLAKRGGAIINVASTAAFQPVPYMAVYAATKAFVLSFSEALWAECRPRGVRVLAFCPGPVDTSFAAAAGSTLTGKGTTAASVAAAALAALGQGRSYVVPGRENYWLSVSSRFAPRSWVAQLSERKMRPSKPDKFVMSDNTEEQLEPATGRGLFNKTAIDSQSVGAVAVGAAASGALAIGALAIGALAVGALAVGTMEIKRLTIGKSRIRSLKIDALEIDELVIRRLVVMKQVSPTETK